MQDQLEQLTASLIDRFDGRHAITVEEGATVLGIGRKTAYESVQRGELPHRRLGRRVVIPLPQLAAYLCGEDQCAS